MNLLNDSLGTAVFVHSALSDSRCVGVCVNDSWCRRRHEQQEYFACKFIQVPAIRFNMVENGHKNWTRVQLRSESSLGNLCACILRRALQHTRIKSSNSTRAQVAAYRDRLLTASLHQVSDMLLALAKANRDLAAALLRRVPFQGDPGACTPDKLEV